MEAEPVLVAPVPVAPVLGAPFLVAPVLVALPGTMCSPAVFEPLAAELAGSVAVHPVSWLTEPGPWDIPAVAGRVAAGIEARWGHPVLVCGHSTGGVAALPPGGFPPPP